MKTYVKRLEIQPVNKSKMKLIIKGFLENENPSLRQSLLHSMVDQIGVRIGTEKLMF